MSNKSTKPRRTGSEIAREAIKAAANKKVGLVGNRSGQTDYTNYYGKEAERLNSIVHEPLNNHEVVGIGAGGEMMLNMRLPVGDQQGIQLRDTVKDPEMITASAQLDRLRLVEEAGALDLALDATDTIQPQNSLEKMLAHQLAALHVHAMRMAGVAGVWLDRATPDEYRNFADYQLANIEATRATNAAAKMMQTFQQGLLTLQRIRSGGKQQVTVVHQHVQVSNGGHAAIAGTCTKGGGKHGDD